MDLVSGSYDGPVFVFPGEGRGRFGAPAQLTDAESKVVVLDSATSVSVADWDGDGKPDFFVGTISGPVWYLPGLGGLKTGKPVRLSAGGQPIEAVDGGPCAVDWDGDGTLDLFVGQDDGRLRFFKGVAGEGTPALAAGVDVLTSLENADAATPTNLPHADPKTGHWDLKRPRMRPKPQVFDWNGDGRPDLLVGDFSILVGKEPELTAADRDKRDQLRAAKAATEAKMSPIVTKAQSDAAKKLGLKPGETDKALLQKWNDEVLAILAADAEYQRLSESLTQTFTDLLKFEGEPGYHGFVWVFLRK